MMSGSKALSPTYEQAHMGLDLLTLASYSKVYNKQTNSSEKGAYYL